MQTPPKGGLANGILLELELTFFFCGSWPFSVLEMCEVSHKLLFLAFFVVCISEMVLMGFTHGSWLYVRAG